MVESAIILPVVLLLVFGIFEFGLLFRSYLSTGDGIGDAARLGGIVGPDRLFIDDGDGGSVGVSADYAILSVMREGTASIPAASIDRVVVFRSGPPGLGSAMDQMPNACKTALNSVAALKCNIYPAEEAYYAVQEGNVAYFDCEDGAGVRACGWPPNERQDGPEASEIDYLGVYVRYNHEWITGLFGSGFSVEQATIIRLEPGVV